MENLKTPEEYLLLKEKTDLMFKAITKYLKPKERQVIYKRFFLGLTLKETAQQCRVSITRVNQIQRHSLKKIYYGFHQFNYF